MSELTPEGLAANELLVPTHPHDTVGGDLRLSCSNRWWLSVGEIRGIDVDQFHHPIRVRTTRGDI